MSYDGFISYSHSADGQLAPALQRGLQRLAKPWNRRRALNLFRDETSLATNPQLWSAIEAAIDSSEWFVLLAGPEAARSEWVGKEIEHWVATKPVARILPVVTDGTWTWDASLGDLTAESTAVPPALRGVLTEEPRHLDLRWARSEPDLDLRNSRFREAIADLAAPMHGVPKDELEGEDVRQHRKARRLARGAIVGLAALALVALVASGLAVLNAQEADRESNRAEREADTAEVRGLSAQAVAQANTTPDLALLLAVEAYRRADSVESRGALLSVLTRTTKLDRLEARAARGEVIAGVSGDGELIARSTDRGRVTLADVASGKTVRTFDSGQDGEVAVFWSPDGNTLVTTAENGTIRLWDTSDGHPRTEPLEAHPSPVREADFSADSRLLATADSSGLNRVWDVATGRALTAPIESTILVDRADLALSSDGRFLALAGTPTRVIDVATMREVMATPLHGLNADTAVGLSADTSTVAVPNQPDGAVDLFDVSSAERLDRRLPLEASDTVVRLAFSPDGSKVAAGMEDGTVTVWDLKTTTGTSVQLSGHGAPVTALVFLERGQLLTVSEDRAIAWDLERPARITMRTRLTEGGLSPLAGVAINRSGDQLAVVGLDGRMWFVEPRTLRVIAGPIQAVAATIYQVPKLEFSDDGTFVVVGSASGMLAYVDARTRQVTRAPLRIVPEVEANDTGGIVDLAVSADGRQVAVTDFGGVTLVNVARWTKQRTKSSIIPLGVDFGSTRGLLAIGDGSGRAVLRNTRNVDRDTVVAREGSPALGISFSADGRLLAVSTYGGVRLIDTSSLRTVGRLAASNTPFSARLSADGRFAATYLGGSWRLWDTRSQRQIGEPMLAHPSGTTLVTGIGGFEFVPGQQAGITVGSDGAVVRWDLDPESWVHLACSTANRNLTRTEWRQYVGDEPPRKTCP